MNEHEDLDDDLDNDISDSGAVSGGGADSEE
jgi:hypothetical protein